MYLWITLKTTQIHYFVRSICFALKLCNKVKDITAVSKTFGTHKQPIITASKAAISFRFCRFKTTTTPDNYSCFYSVINKPNYNIRLW